jgi:outer membrane protein OmpA-like peptidoglycan-associated protein
VIALLLIGFWIWRGRQAAVHRTAATFNSAEVVRSANERASAALAALQPGFSSKDLVGALNLEVINFSTGSAEIPTDSAAVLDQGAAAMKKAPPNSKIEIQGHTDAQGDAASNMKLSQERADAVRTYLIQQGVDGSMLVAKGYGDTQPVAGNDTEEGRFRNRRIEFLAVD